MRSKTRFVVRVGHVREPVDSIATVKGAGNQMVPLADRGRTSEVVRRVRSVTHQAIPRRRTGVPMRDPSGIRKGP